MIATVKSHIADVTTGGTDEPDSAYLDREIVCAGDAATSGSTDRKEILDTHLKELTNGEDRVTDISNEDLWPFPFSEDPSESWSEEGRIIASDKMGI